MKKHWALLRALLIVVIGLLAIGRGAVAGESAPAENRFKDPQLRAIYDLQNRRGGSALLKYLRHERPEYRRAAALAFGSVQWPGAVAPLSALLSDKSEDVRLAAAHALGQTGDKGAQPALMAALKVETSASVGEMMGEALGKCGTANGLAFLIALDYPTERPRFLVGRAQGIYRFALRGIVSPGGTAAMLEMLGAKMPEKVRFVAANYAMRARNIDLTGRDRELTGAYKRERALHTRTTLLAAMEKTPTPGVRELLRGVLAGDGDYRLKVAALKALRGFKYETVVDVFLHMAGHGNVHVAVAASEYFPGNGREADGRRYFERARALTQWRARANLLSAALDFAAGETAKKHISRHIIDTYEKSAHRYEKAMLLMALGGDPANLDYVNTITFGALGKDPVLVSYGMEAVAKICLAHKGNPDKLREFAGLFKRAVETGDNGMIIVASDLLRDPELNFKTIYKNKKDIEFLTAALEKCRLPRDLEGAMELRKTIGYFVDDYFTGVKDDATAETPAAPVNRAMDWTAVAAVPPGCRVRVKTPRGTITIRLLVDESPASVVNFLSLIKKGFYQGAVFHRVVPGFVIQGGCPRGDGAGGPDYTIGSELGPLYYDDEGIVGMASAGKDTEGSQWFITHGPIPHADGQYTIFGRVESGMDVVHNIEAGDGILGFEVLTGE